MLNETEQNLIVDLFRKIKKRFTHYEYASLARLAKRKPFLIQSTNGHDGRCKNYELTDYGFVLASILYDLNTGVIHPNPKIIIKD